jgi:hypothetical protein
MENESFSRLFISKCRWFLYFNNKIFLCSKCHQFSKCHYIIYWWRPSLNRLPGKDLWWFLRMTCWSRVVLCFWSGVHFTGPEFPLVVLRTLCSSWVFLWILDKPGGPEHPCWLWAPLQGGLCLESHCMLITVLGTVKHTTVISCHSAQL